MLDMNEAFYIVKVREDFYQVRLVFNKECIATAFTLEEALNKIKLLAERYCSEDKLREAWRKTDMKPSKGMTLEYNNKVYEAYKDIYKDDINKIFEAEKPKLLTKRSKLIKSATPKINDVEKQVKNAPLEAKNNILLKPKKKILFKK